MKPLKNFQIDDIDGCEFVKDTKIGKMLISYDHDGTWGHPTGLIQVVYPDGSSGRMDYSKAQKKLDSGEWTVYRTK